VLLETQVPKELQDQLVHKELLDRQDLKVSLAHKVKHSIIEEIGIILILMTH
jgi:hypothetical protein